MFLPQDSSGRDELPDRVDEILGVERLVENHRRSEPFPLAVHRFVGLLQEMCPGAKAAGPLVDPAEWRFETRSIRLRKARLDLKLGVTLPDERVHSILESLEFGVEAVDDGFDVSVPSFRATKDITVEDDLIEEVGRMFRYDNIPEQPLVSTVSSP